MKKLILILIAVLIHVNGYSQAPPTVPHYVLETRSDYSKYNDDILKCCQWLPEANLPENLPQIAEIRKFIMEWSLGSPDVSVIFYREIRSHLESCPMLILWFYAGSIEYQLENKINALKREEKIESTIAGIDMAIDFYKKNKSKLKKCTGINELIKLQKKGALKEHLEGIILHDTPKEKMDTTKSQFYT